MDRSGKCLCGAVSFVAKGIQPDKASTCHCEMCQRWSGGPWIAIFVQELDFERDEGLRWIQSSGFAERGFCHRCGSSLFWRMTAEGKYQGTTTVTLGCLDDRSGVSIVKEWFIDRKPDAYAFEGERECITEAEVLAMMVGRTERKWRVDVENRYGWSLAHLARRMCVNFGRNYVWRSTTSASWLG